MKQKISPLDTRSRQLLDTRGFRDDEPLIFDLAEGVIRAAELEALLRGTAIIEIDPATGESRHIPQAEWKKPAGED